MTTDQKKRVRKLVAALKSGKYKQGHSALYEDGKYCCLGVACDLHRKMSKKNGWIDGEYLDYYSELPDVVRKYFGFSGPDPAILLPGRKRKCCAIWANDKLKRSFADIAIGFEREYLGKSA